jgi:hypothetical protein
MIKLIDILNQINEGKQVGNLYHFTDIFNLIKILETNTLKSSNKWKPEDKPFVSFTRNKDAWGLVAQVGKTVRITIDGDKLSNNYKISPFNIQKTKRWDNTPLDEMEERVFGDIKNIKNYITDITIQIVDLKEYPKLEDKLKLLYPDYKVLNKISRRDKLVPYDQVALPLSDDVKKYIQDIILKQKIEAAYEFPDYEMINYFNKQLNTNYDSLSVETKNYIKQQIY